MLRLRRIWKLKERGDIPELVHTLRNGSWLERSVSAMALGHLRDGRSEGALVTALGDQNTIVRQVAARALREVNPQPELRKVVAGMRGHPAEPLPDAPTADEIVSAGLWHLESVPALETILSALPEANDVDRTIYLAVLGDLNDNRATPALIEHLDHSHENVRAAAATSIGRLRDTLAIDPLIRMLDDPSKDVRRATVEALAEIGPPAEDALRRTASDATSRRTQRAAKRALARMARSRE